MTQNLLIGCIALGAQEAINMLKTRHNKTIPRLDIIDQVLVDGARLMTVRLQVLLITDKIDIYKMGEEFGRRYAWALIEYKLQKTPMPLPEYILTALKNEAYHTNIKPFVV